jgi:hypothetical protein
MNERSGHESGASRSLPRDWLPEPRLVCRVDLVADKIGGIDELQVHGSYMDEG